MCLPLLFSYACPCPRVLIRIFHDSCNISFRDHLHVLRSSLQISRRLFHGISVFIIKIPAPYQNLQIMGTNLAGDIRKLFTKLKEANKQAHALKQEVEDIRRQIHVLSETEIFKQYLDSADDFGDDSFSLSIGDNLDGLPPNNHLAISTSTVPPSKRTKYDFKTEDGYVVAFTDGACENNGKTNAKAGIGVWFGNNHPLNLSEPVQGRPTNNTAEIQACIAAVKIALENDLPKLKIKTDSQFTINCMTQWIHKWKKNNWKLAGSGGDVKNKTDLQELDRISKSLDLRYEHVAGHKGVTGNEEADRLARQGASRYKRLA